MAKISLHVLDTAKGIPAAGIAVHLYRLSGDQRELCASAVTNSDGRTDNPLISAERIPAGIYELIFAAGSYFRSTSPGSVEPLFLDEIVIRFGVSEPAGNYHVPLLVAPHGYSTYRGS